MKIDFNKALQQLRQDTPGFFERAIFDLKGIDPFPRTSRPITPKSVKPVIEVQSEVEAVSMPVPGPIANGIKVLFVSDSYSDSQALQDEEKVSNPIGKKLLGHFSPDVIELFSKMIQAMGLGIDDFQIRAVKKNLDDGTEQEQLLQVSSAAVEFKPKLVITIGAVATNTTLGFEERLAQVHGKFFNRAFEGHGENFAASVMPLFHPQLLLINPGMKRTAWADMQKAMDLLKH